MNWKIVVDTGANLRQIDDLASGTSFIRVPLTLQIGNQIFVDDDGLNIDDMMTTLYETDAAARSASPSPQAFADAYAEADNVIAVTITGSLSGSQNAAQIGKTMALEENPNANIHVIDSLSAGGEMDLLLVEINRLISQGLSFEEVVDAITAYQKRTKLLFVLAKVDNLVKNGRLSKLAGAVAGLLNIRIVGEASPEGKLELLNKSRGQKKAIKTTLEEMFNAGYQGGKVIIGQRNGQEFTQHLITGIKERFPEALIQTVELSGLCSFYAEDGGIMMGYEI